MIVAKTRMALFFVVVLGIAGLCVLAVCHQSAEPREIFRLGGFNVLCLDGLVWEGGERKLDDLLPNFSEMKG